MAQLAHADEAGELPSVGVAQGFRHGALALQNVGHPVLQQIVVTGKLAELTVPVQIDPAVAHGDPPQRIARDQGGHHRGAAGVKPLGAEHLIDGAVDTGHHTRQRGGNLIRLKGGAEGQRLHDDLLADPFSAGEAAHAVGQNRQNARIAEHGCLTEAVLLVIPSADIMDLSEGDTGDGADRFLHGFLGDGNGMYLRGCGRLHGLFARALMVADVLAQHCQQQDIHACARRENEAGDPHSQTESG